MSKILDDIMAAKEALDSLPKPRDDVYCVAPQVESKIKEMIPERQELQLVFSIASIKIRTLPALNNEAAVHCVPADHECLGWSDYNLAMFLNALELAKDVMGETDGG